MSRPTRESLERAQSFVSRHWFYTASIEQELAALLDAAKAAGRAAAEREIAADLTERWAAIGCGHSSLAKRILSGEYRKGKP